MLSEFSDTGTKRGILGVFFERRKDEKGSYLHVTEVIRGSPAERHGMKASDRILELNRRRIKEGMKIHTALMRGPDSGANQIKIMRGIEALTLYVNSSDIAGYLPLPLDERLLGLRLSDIRGT